MPTRMDGWIANELPRTTWNRQIGHRAAEYSRRALIEEKVVKVGRNKGRGSIGLDDVVI